MAHQHIHSEHSHEHDCENNHEKKNGNKTSEGLVTAFWLNTCFTVIEVVGGIMTNSTAILTDSLHDFGDTLAIASGIMLEKISQKKGSNRYSFGYRRFSLLSALILSVILFSGAIVMLVESISAFEKTHEVKSVGMFGLAVLGIAINGLAFLRIKKGKNDHHHAHAHTHGGENLNEKAIMLHFMEDVLGWVAVLVGAVIIYLTGWNWIDPLLTVGIALFIGYNAAKNLVATMRIFLQAVPENVNLELILSELQELDHVVSVHDLHVWTLDGSYHLASVHLVTTPVSRDDQFQVKAGADRIFKNFQINHLTVQMETADKCCDDKASDN